jgi:hypothetical protein
LGLPAIAVAGKRPVNNMKNLKVAALVLIGFCASHAQAFACRSYANHNEVYISDVVVNEGAIPKCPAGTTDPALTTYFFLSSPGGYIDHIKTVVSDLRKELDSSFETSQVTPTVIVQSHCESACIPILSALNKMAAEGFIHLVVDRHTILGFHGCSDPDSANPNAGKHFSIEGTQRYHKIWKTQGGNPEWIDLNAAFFESDKIHELKPDDPRLWGSQILDYAEIGDAGVYQSER